MFVGVLFTISENWSNVNISQWGTGEVTHAITNYTMEFHAAYNMKNAINTGVNKEDYSLCSITPCMFF